MLKYVEIAVTFSEVPDEISLCIEISNCPCHCKGCHSSYLAEDIGIILGRTELMWLINNNIGITCVAFMGGDSSTTDINSLAKLIREVFPELKVAWYSGRQELSKDIDLKNFDFIKLGPYIEEFGPLNSKTTNQRFYKVVDNGNPTYELVNITNKFWKNDKVN